MTIDLPENKNLKWLPAWQDPISLEGFPWFKKDKIYCRLPMDSIHTVNPEVKALSYSTAGGQLRFCTNSANLEIEVELSGPANMPHMPATGQCGFDCYITIPNGGLKYCNTTSFDHTQTKYRSVFYEGIGARMREVIINFPLYQGVQNVRIGIDQDAQIHAPRPHINDKRLIIYGTSITQGGCASRPGMAYSNILSRWLDMECINLGFSGNGKGQPEVARIISQIKDPACLLIDYEANCPSAEHIAITLPKFIEIYRARHKSVPIIVLSRVLYASYLHDASWIALSDKKRAVQIEVVDEVKRNGDDNTYFIDGSILLGDDFDEMTVDGVHPTDLGFFTMAQGLYPIMRTILGLTSNNLK